MDCSGSGRDKWWDVVNTLNEFSGSVKCGEFLD
jgi:hypothetical protein